MVLLISFASLMIIQLIDHYSRHGDFYLLSQSSKALDYFKHFVVEVEYQIERKDGSIKD